jgi:hypothetical protein
MTDILKTLDDAQRKLVEDRRKTAREHPTFLLFGQLVTVWANVWLLRRIAGKLGLSMTRLQAYALVGIFGRDPGYPYNLIWQEKPVKPEVRAAAKAMTAPYPRGPGSPPRPRREPMPDTGA